MTILHNIKKNKIFLCKPVRGWLSSLPLYIDITLNGAKYYIF